MNVIIYFTAAVLGVLLIGHTRSTKGSGYTLLQTLFFAYATKE